MWPMPPRGSSPRPSAMTSRNPWNLGSGQEISIQDLAVTIAELTGFEGRIVWDTSQPNGQPRRRLDVSRAEREFGFRARTPLDEGLRKTVEWVAGTERAAAGNR